MQLPQILATNGVPATIPGEGPSMEAATAVSRTVERGAQQAGQAAEHALFWERQKQLERENDEAVNLYLGATSKLGALESDLKLGKRDPNTGEMVEPPATDVDYVQRAQQGRDQILQDTLAQTPNARIQFTLHRMLKREFASHSLAAQTYANKLFIDTKTAALNDNEDAMAQQMAADPSPENMERLNALHGAYMESQTNFLPETERRKRVIAMRERLGLIGAKSAIDNTTDPMTVDLKAYTKDLKPEDAMKLGIYQRQAQDHIYQMQDRDQKRVEHEVAQARTSTFADLTDSVLQGKETEASARANPGWRFLDGSQRQHIIEMITNPKTMASDPATRTWLIQSLGDRPTITEAQIKRANRDGKLNDDDTRLGLTWLNQRRDHYTSIAREEGHRAEDQTRHDLERRNSEVSRIGTEALSLTGALAERLDPKAQEIKAIYSEQLLRRSKGSGQPLKGGMPRNEEPEDVMYDTLPNLMERLADGVQGDYQKIQRIIDVSGIKTREQLKAKYPGPPSAYMDVPQYVEARKRLDDLDDAKQQYDALQERIKAARERAKVKK